MITPERLAASGTEHGNQAALFLWANLNKDKYPQLKWLFAVPNGFYSDGGQKAKMKAEGLKDGVPDVWLPVPKFNIPLHALEYAGLVIEMKIEARRKKPNGGLETEQIEWMNYLKIMGYQHHVCYSWEEARDRILEYLK